MFGFPHQLRVLRVHNLILFGGLESLRHAKILGTPASLQRLGLDGTHFETVLVVDEVEVGELTEFASEFRCFGVYCGC